MDNDYYFCNLLHIFVHIKIILINIMSSCKLHNICQKNSGSADPPKTQIYLHKGTTLCVDVIL